MNEDMSEFLGVFLDEANEQMQLLEEHILHLEQSSTPALLDEIFRAAHTLKGSSRAMGFTSMGELTHALEDVFDQLRQNKMTVYRELIDALFGGLDSLKAMMEDISRDSSTSRDTTRETARLRKVLQAEGKAEEKEEKQRSKEKEKIEKEKIEKEKIEEKIPEQPSSSLPLPSAFQTVLSEAACTAMREARNAGCAIYGLKVEVSPDCVMKSVRALMALQALDRVSATLASWPDEDGLESETFDATFEVILATEANADEIVGALEGVNEIRCALIAPWELPEERKEEENSASAGAATVQNPKSTLQNSQKETIASDGAETSKAQNVKPKVQNATVRVDVARLDKLLNLIGELVIDRTRIAGLGQRLEAEYKGSALLESLNETSVHIGRITDELQDEIMKARMLPVDSVFSRFPRMIRDLAQKLNKEVQFLVEGQETELDRSVIEVIGDPLIHMLRNSIDHGIESPQAREKAGKPRVGTVWLRARHQENSIVIEIQDDGQGIDPDKLRAGAVKKGILTAEAAQRMTNREAVHLIFAPGFSTAQTLTDVSGRGVGMDIVRSNLQRLGALIDIDSKVGEGTTFRVQLPLTLAIIRGLLVSAQECVYALPLNSVVETLRVEPDAIHRINHREVIWQRGKTLPLVRLRDVLPTYRGVQRFGCSGIQESVPPLVLEPDCSDNPNTRTPEYANTRTPQPLNTDALYIVVAGAGDKQVGFVVDALVGEQEVVIKTLGNFIGEIKGIAGATILGDGRVALIADINGLTAIAAEEKGKAHAA